MVMLGLLPQVGQEIPCSCYAVNVPLQVNVLGVITLDFKGGFKLRVDSSSSAGLGGVKLKLIAFEVSADSPVLGKVTLSLASTDTTPLSSLDFSGISPPVFRNRLLLDFTTTIGKPPGGGPPMQLSNTRPAVLVNDSLTAFPPQGSVYQLQEPVDLGPIGTPGQVIAQLLQFPVTVSHNP